MRLRPGLRTRTFNCDGLHLRLKLGTGRPHKRFELGLSDDCAPLILFAAKVQEADLCLYIYVSVGCDEFANQLSKSQEVLFLGDLYVLSCCGGFSQLTR